MKRVGRIESAVSNEVSGGEAGLRAATWSSLLQEELLTLPITVDKLDYQIAEFERQNIEYRKMVKNLDHKS